MKKVYRLENLDCAHCASMMEESIQKIPGVNACSITFMTQKLSIEADEENLAQILEKADAAIRRIEPHCKIIRP
ncbi:MAG: heavy metal-associated domain-containing protein [Methanocorpusculum sp.]|nr:heavy metal-associated domain-containing protein [Methanocorpusculum sp.]